MKVEQICFKPTTLIPNTRTKSKINWTYILPACLCLVVRKYLITEFVHKLVKTQVHLPTAKEKKLLTQWELSEMVNFKFILNEVNE